MDFHCNSLPGLLSTIFTIIDSNLFCGGNTESEIMQIPDFK